MYKKYLPKIIRLPMSEDYKYELNKEMTDFHKL